MIDRRSLLAGGAALALPRVAMAQGDSRPAIIERSVYPKRTDAPDAAPDLVRAALRRAAASLRAGSRAEAEAALSGPAVAYGPSATLGRLASMPRLPQTVAAAGMVASDFDRLDRIR